MEIKVLLLLVVHTMNTTIAQVWNGTHCNTLHHEIGIRSPAIETKTAKKGYFYRITRPSCGPFRGPLRWYFHGSSRCVPAAGLSVVRAADVAVG